MRFRDRRGKIPDADSFPFHAVKVANPALVAASKGRLTKGVPVPKPDEVENLRFMLRHAHEKRDSFVRKAMRRVEARFGASIHKKAIVERIETTSKRYAA